MAEQNLPGEYQNQYKFNAKEQDVETGLYYYGARYYNPRISTWYGVDPLAEKMPSWSPYAYAFDNPINWTDPTGMEPEDWIKNNKTGKFEWRNEVTKPSETPTGYSYIGKEDSDIVKNLFGGTQFSATTNDTGAISMDDYDNPYSSKGAAVTNANFTSTMTASFSADVNTAYDSEGNISGKTFKGVNINVSISGTNTAQSSASISLSGEKMTLQGNNVAAALRSPNGDIRIGGDISPLSYRSYWNANSIQKNYGRSYNLDFKFKGQYFNGKTPLGYMGPAFFVPNKTNLNLSVKFRNNIIRNILQ
ncbi:RHS repeat-associated core domain-containing protein [Chryseobacterium sp. MFBS3-17]|nr:RHS repeat-associated core domain-containing protein [Chryseobacterium sp. MFBS3-17]